MHRHAGELVPELADDLLAELDDVVLGHERHLDVQLGELGLPVGPEVLVPIAARDLVVALHARDHEQLFEQLRRLRQGVPGAGLQADRDQEVAGALGRRAGQRRRLDLMEVAGVQHLAGDLVGPAAQLERAGRPAAPQVEVAVLESQVVGGRDGVVHRQRERRRLRQDSQIAGDDLDGAGGQVRVLVAGRPRGHRPRDQDAVLVAERVRVLLPEHHLDHAGGVAEVDEDDAAVVAPAGDPAGERHRRAGVARAEAAGVMGTDHGNVSPHEGSRGASDILSGHPAAHSPGVASSDGTSSSGSAGTAPSGVARSDGAAASDGVA